jgi:hypothetical protein
MQTQDLIQFLRVGKLTVRYLNYVFSRREFLWSAVETVLSMSLQSADRGKGSLANGPVKASKMYSVTNNFDFLDIICIKTGVTSVCGLHGV